MSVYAFIIFSCNKIGRHIHLAVNKLQINTVEFKVTACLLEAMPLPNVIQMVMNLITENVVLVPLQSTVQLDTHILLRVSLLLAGLFA